MRHMSPKPDIDRIGFGQGAARLNLTGDISETAFSALCCHGRGKYSHFEPVVYAEGEGRFRPRCN